MNYNDDTPTHPNRQPLEWANYYNRKGLTVVPVHKMSKQPVGKAWQKNLDNIINISLLHKDSNLGIMLGEHSNGYVDLDLDCFEARHIASAFLPDTVTFGRDSAEHSHYVYFTTVDEEAGETVGQYHKKYTYEGLGTIAEFRSSTGSQTVHPPSVHAGTGELVHWYVDDPMAHITTLPAKELYDAYLKMVAMVILTQHIMLGIKHHATLHVVGALWHLGWEIEEVEHFVDVMIDHCDMSDGDDRRKCVYDTFTNGEQYGQNIGGFGELLRVFDDSGQDGAMIVRALRRVLEQTARGEKRVLSPHEVFSRCAGIRSAMSGFMDVEAVVAPPAALMDAPLAPVTQSALPDTTQLLQPTLESINAPPTELINEPPAELLSGSKVISASDIEISIADELVRTNNQPFEYLVENLLPANELGFVFGDSGTYKTFTVIDILMSASYLDNWAGKRIAPDMGDMLMVTGEGRNTISDRVRVWLQNQGIGCDVKPNNNLYIYNNYMDLFDDPRRDINAQDAMSEFAQYLEQRPNIKLVVFDTLSSLFSGDENQSKDVAPTLKRMKELCEQHRVTMLIVHHKGKSGLSFRGSGALTANSDFNFDISKEVILGENGKPGVDDEPTGRIIFEDMQQRSGASNTRLFFRPRVLDVVGRQTNFGKQLQNVVMDVDTGDAVKHATYKKKEKMGFDALTSSSRNDHIQVIRDCVEVFDELKQGPAAHVTPGLTLEQLHEGVKSRFMKRGSDKFKRKQNFSRVLMLLRDKGLVGIKMEGGRQAIAYYYLNALAHSDIAKQDAQIQMDKLSMSSIFD